ncbi:S1/P1 nuclease [Sphingomonas morindae]|uniref:S1/P1 nuclease n=1 Tax=Sphingomonas morindae TaxID=1541170 RepID=A0ABY4X8A4_9SPHN|nr:S1/P1 nuclease [Sphingomonas morindae]USI72875.1 S1/P1 nuclease [Sphingomonas morindae]
MKRFAILLAAVSGAVPLPAFAWGFQGHRIVAEIARAELTPAVRAKVDAILANDGDALTAHDMASEATWADVYRSRGHRETGSWHFVDTEIDGSVDQDAACFGHPAPDQPASTGPAQDCVVDKIREFAAELAAPGTAPQERLFALKFLLHFIGDEHQPLHASDKHDRGGNCILLSLGGSRTQNLHAYWDTNVVQALGSDPAQVAAMLRARITPALRTQWQKGDAASWAQEAYGIARSLAYSAGSPAACSQDPAPITLPAGYDLKAQAAAAVQLERAGVRLGLVLNQALADVALPAAAAASTPAATPGSAGPAQGGGRTPASLACSAAADSKGLHGRGRQAFRRSCIRNQRMP